MERFYAANETVWQLPIRRACRRQAQTGFRVGAKGKETKKEEAAEGACRLADRDSMSGRLVLLLLLHEQCLRRKMAHDLHPDCNVHHAPPVAGNVSAAGVGGRRCHAQAHRVDGSNRRQGVLLGRKARGHNAHRTRRAGGQAGRHRGHGASDRDHDARRRAGAGEGSVLRTVLGAGPTDDGGVC